MFPLFRKKGIDVSSVTIPDFGFTKNRDEKSIIQWINAEQTIAISINFFDAPPDLPAIKEINTVRSFYRQLISGANGGLVEAELYRKDSISFIKTIFKLPQTPAGITYIASLTLPFKTFSFVLKVQAAEAGPTGMREALIAGRLMSEGIIPSNGNMYSNWQSDPYDSTFQGGLLMNRSELIDYYPEFPDHPLTKARQLIRQIENDFHWSAQIEKAAAFVK